MIPTRACREDEAHRASARHLRRRAALVALLLLSMLLGSALIATARTPLAHPIGPIHFVPAMTSVRFAPAVTSDDALTAARTTAGPITVPPGAVVGVDARVPFSRPEIETRAASAKTEAKVKPMKIRARGSATWYCLAGVSECHRSHSAGLYAAAGPELRVGDWRGRLVQVCTRSDCVTVRLIDWCACAGSRVIDLYGDAYRRLAPLSSGVLDVTVGW